MTGELARAVGERELVAFTGGGGKTTLLLTLAGELAAGAPVLVTTTTKLGLDETGNVPVAWSIDEAAAVIAANAGQPVFVLSGRDGHKVRGLPPGDVDRLFHAGTAPYVLVEADGSRGRSLKAPAAHEPVVPSTATLVVVVVGVDAVGRPYSVAAHRPATAAALVGAGVDDPITTEAAAAVITSPAGGLKGIPEGARVVVTITKTTRRRRALAEHLRELVSASERVEQVLVVDHR